MPDSVRATMVYPAATGRSSIEGIQEFIAASRVALSDFAAPITADVFGRVITVRSDSVIGQDWDELAFATDVILPMVYPSLYRPGNFGIPDPAAEPYLTVRSALDHAVVRLDALASPRATIRPWLQAFTQDGVVYGVSEMQAQIRAVEDAGLEEWLFWNPDGVYPLEGLQ